MRTARWLSMGICGLAAVALLTGCGTHPKDLEIRSLKERIADLEEENERCRQGYAIAIRDRDNARRRADGLAQQNADLRAMLANRQAPEQLPSGWQSDVSGWTWTDVGSDFLFDSGRATLKPAGRAKISDVADQIKSNFGDMMILVIGHTDTDPIKKTKHLWQDNLDLSANRAMTVFRELAKLGISTAQLVAAGQGEYAPIAPNGNDAGKAQNRRVQIVAVPMPSGRSEAAPPAQAPVTEAAPSGQPAVEK